MTAHVLRYLSDMRPIHLEQWKDLLRIPSVSALPEHREDMERCASYLARHLQEIGLEHVRLLETGGPPVVYGDWLHAPGRPTVLIYGHYDVQPADPLEEWESPPFEPSVRDGMIYARGASDNKGQLFMHLKVLEAYLQTAGSLPVNVRICIEGEEEVGSPHLAPLLERHRELFAADVIVISDTAMLGPDRPSLCYGLRGLAALEIRVQGANTDLPSGLYGGAVPNAAQALAELLASMKGPDGRVTVEGFYDDVAPLSPEEKEAIRSLPDENERLARELGVAALFGEAGYSTWERRWTRPTLELNGISGGYQGPGVKTVIPSRATAKITCRLVPRQDPERIFALVEEHVKRHTPPGVTAAVKRLKAAPAYVAPADHPAIRLALKAYEAGYGTPATLIRAGGSIPIVETFARLYGVPVVLMGFAQPDARAHAPNEHFSLANFDKGLRTLCRYWETLGEARL